MCIAQDLRKCRMLHLAVIFVMFTLLCLYLILIKVWQNNCTNNHTLKSHIEVKRLQPDFDVI